MKKLRYLLSAFLLIASWAAVSAQSYKADIDWDQSDGSIIYDGSKVAFYSAANKGGYLNGENDLTAELTTDAAYTIVAAGRNAEDGSPLWLLQQLSTGKYIKKSPLTWYMLDGAVTEYEYTESIDDAMGFTILQNWPIELDGVEGATPRTISSNANQDIDDFAWVLCTEFVLDGWTDPFTGAVSDSVIYTYLGSSGGYPALFTLYDANCWWIYPLSSAVGADYLEAAYNDIAIHCQPGSLIAGIDPGNYGADEVAAYTEVYNELVDQLENYTYNEEQTTDLVERLRAAKEALDASLVEFEAGKYYMFGGNANANGVYLRHLGSAWKFAKPADLSAVNFNDAAYYFFAEDAGEDADGKKLFKLKNFESGDYITSHYVDGVVTPGGTPAVLRISMPSGAKLANAYNIIDTDEAASADGVFHHTSDNQLGSTYTFLMEREEALFTIKTLPEDGMAALEAIYELEKRKIELAEIIGLSKALQAATKVYRPSADCTLDGNLGNPGLVTAANCLSSNADHNALNPESHDGEGLAGLLDNDVTTYFHSAWQNAPTATHFIDANLNREVDGISLKLARRIHDNQNPAPAMFEVYVSADSAEWVAQGTLSVKYDYDHSAPAPDDVLALYPDSVIVRTGFVGIGALPFNGAYRYVRLAVPASHTQGGQDAFFYMSELRYYAGADYDKAASVYEKAPLADRTAFETALAAADTEYAAGTPTQATIDALRAAYETLLEGIPSTSDLHKLIDSYRNLLASAEEGDGIGFYAEGSKAAFEAVIDRIANELDEDWGNQQIAEAEAELRAAYHEFYTKFQLPEETKVYAIRTMAHVNGDNGNGSTISKCGQYLTSEDFYVNKAVKGAGYEIEPGGQFVEGRDFDELDMASTYTRLWVFEYNEAGDSVYIRNAATGLYLGCPNTTAEPYPFALELFENSNDGKVEGRNNFVFRTSDGSVLCTDYMIAVTVGQDAADASAAFRIEEIEASGEITHKAKGTSAEIMCLPYTVSSYTLDGDIYEVLGTRVDTATNKKYLVLGSIYDEVIKAGTPFIFNPASRTNKTVTFYLSDDSGNTIDTGAPQLSLEGRYAYGMVGVVKNGTVVSPSIGRIESNQIKVSQYDYTVPPHSGYITCDKLDEVDVLLDEYKELLMGTGEINVSDIETILAGGIASPDVYTIDGRFVGKSVEALPAGIYIVGGKKYLVK